MDLKNLRANQFHLNLYLWKITKTWISRGAKKKQMHYLWCLQMCDFLTADFCKNQYIEITNLKIYIWDNLKHHNFIHFISQLSMVVVNGGVIIGLVALLATTNNWRPGFWQHRSISRLAKKLCQPWVTPSQWSSYLNPSLRTCLNG